MSKLKTFVPLAILFIGTSIVAAEAAEPQQAQPATSAPAQQAPAQSKQGQTNSNDDVLLPPEGAPETQQQAPATTTAPAPAPSSNQQPSAQQPAAQEPSTLPAQNPANQPSNTVEVQKQGRQPDVSDNDRFVFRTEVQEVTLHATVVDDRQHPVTTLDRTAFQVFEDGKPQRITSFRREDIPVALGIVIDNSGSMRASRPAVNEAALDLVRSSNPQDQVFVVNFNNEYYLDQDYTGDTGLLKDALERIESRGGTALYDAVVASADHLMKSAKLQRKVILVVTDGADNASRETLEQAVRHIAVDGGPTVYAIGLMGDNKEKRAQRALRILSEQTGGVAFFPRNLSEVDSIAQQVARDIRNQYTIGYKPTNPKTAGGYRTVRVDANAKGFKKLNVRTRSGYYANEQQRAAAATPAGQK